MALWIVRPLDVLVNEGRTEEEAGRKTGAHGKHRGRTPMAGPEQGPVTAEGRPPNPRGKATSIMGGGNRASGPNGQGHED